MKWLRILIWIGLGASIWGLSLVWPEINQLLAPQVMAKLVLTLGLIILAYLMGYYRRQNNQRPPAPCDPVKQKHSSRPSRPVRPLSPA